MCYGNVEIARTQPPRRGNDAGRVRRSDLSGWVWKSVRIRRRREPTGRALRENAAHKSTRLCVAAGNVRPENVWRIPNLSITRERRVSVDGGCVQRRRAKRYLSHVPNSPATKGLRDAEGFMNIFDVCLPNNRRI